MNETDRLHPETLRTLRQLVRLHGADALVAEIRAISATEREPIEPPADYIPPARE